jgi:outer membrane biosynthesis protein TonB
MLALPPMFILPAMPAPPATTSAPVVVDVEVVRTSSYDILDKTAVEHISNMKHWKPGIANGETVKVEFIIPISFNVSDSFIRW